MIKVKVGKYPRISQGDIFRDVEHIERIAEKEGIVEISKILFPLIIVLTQDCDLEQDYRFRWSRKSSNNTQDKYLLSVLVAPLYNLEHVYQGTHLNDIGLSMEPINKKRTPANFC